MAQQIIDVGSSPNDGQGDPIRTSFIKTNNNFNELYSRVQTSPPSTLIGSVGDRAGMIAYTPTYFYYCFADYDGVSNVWATVDQSGNVIAEAMEDGASSIAFDGPDGPVTITVNGYSNVAIFEDSGTTLTNLTATGSIIATGNIDGGNINATGNIDTTGSINTTGTVTSGSQYVNGVVSAAGNVDAGNINTIGTVTSGSQYVTGDINVVGNVNVSGNLNYENVNDLVVGDPLIYIGANNTGNALDLGIVASWNDGTYQHGGWVRDASDGTWKLFGNVVEEPTTVIDFANAIYQPMLAGAITSTSNVSAVNFLASSSIELDGNLSISANKNIDLGNNVISNVADPLSGSDAATKTYVDSQVSSSSFDISDGAVTESVVTGDTLTFQGTANEVTVAVSAPDTVTIGLPNDVSIAGNLSANYLIGNGSQLTGVSTNPNKIFNGNSAVSIDSANANVNITVGPDANSSIFSAGSLFTGIVAAPKSLVGNVIMAPNCFGTIISGTVIVGNLQIPDGTTVYTWTPS